MKIYKFFGLESSWQNPGSASVMFYLRIINVWFTEKIFTRIHLQVGQYLMTLPQQLEPFTMQDNPQVTVALKYGKLPYTTQQGNQLLFFSNITYWVIVYFFENKIIYAFQFFILIELPEHLADLWLESLARGTMHHYSEQILKILELSSLGTRQLITDIGTYSSFFIITYSKK